MAKKEAASVIDEAPTAVVDAAALKSVEDKVDSLKADVAELKEWVKRMVRKHG